MLLLLALLLFIFLPSPANVIAGLVCLVLAACEVAFWQRRVRRGKVETGVGNLVGATGEVTERIAPSGRVRVHGELWQGRPRRGPPPRAEAPAPRGPRPGAAP